MNAKDPEKKYQKAIVKAFIVFLTPRGVRDRQVAECHVQTEASSFRFLSEFRSIRRLVLLKAKAT